MNVKFAIAGLTELSQEFIEANHLVLYGNVSGVGYVYYMNDRQATSVETGELIPFPAETPDITGYHKEGWAYQDRYATYHQIDMTTETAGGFAHVNYTDGATPVYSFIYTLESSLPLITYKYGSQVIGTQRLGLFDELVAPEDQYFTYTWDMPTERPTADTVVNATARTAKTYNFTIQLVNRPWLYNGALVPSKTFQLQYGTNIADFIANSTDKFIKWWRDYDDDEVPCWGSVVDSSLPETMPTEDVTYTRTYTVNSQHWHDVTFRFHERKADGTSELKYQTISNLPYGYIIPMSNKVATKGSNSYPVPITDGPWHDFYEEQMPAGYEYCDVQYTDLGDYLEPNLSSLFGLRDQDIEIDFTVARLVSLTLKTVDENGEVVSTRQITDRYEGDKLTSYDLEVDDWNKTSIWDTEVSMPGYTFVFADGIQDYRINHEDSEVIVGTYRKKYKVYYKYGNDALKIRTSNSFADYKEYMSGEVIDENIPLYSSDESTSYTNGGNPHIIDFTYPNSVVDKRMPAQDIEVQVVMAYKRTLYVIFNNDQTDILFRQDIYYRDPIVLKYELSQHLRRDDRSYKLVSLGELPETMPDNDIYVSATYNPVWQLTLNIGKPDRIESQKHLFYATGETIEYPVFGVDIPAEFHMGKGCMGTGWDGPETMPAEDTTVFCTYVEKVAISAEVYKDGQLDCTFSLATGYPNHSFDAVDVLKNSYYFKNFRWNYQRPDNSLPGGVYAVHWDMTDFPEHVGVFPENDTVVMTGEVYNIQKYYLTVKVSGTGEVLLERQYEPYTQLFEIDGDKLIYHLYGIGSQQFTDEMEIVNVDDAKSVYDIYTDKYLMPENDLVIYVRQADFSRVRLYIEDKVWKTMAFQKGTKIYYKDLLVPDSFSDLDGYSFKGWRTPDGVDITPSGGSFVLSSDEVNLTAILYIEEFFPEVYTITYKVDDEVYRTAQYKAGQAVTSPTAPYKDGFKFVKWEPQVTVMPEFDITVNAVYTEDVATPDQFHSLSFVIEDKIVYQTTVRQGASVPQPVIAPRDGYRVVWTNVPATMPAEDTVINGYWDVVSRPIYYVNFYISGSIFMRVGYYENETVYPVEAPEREGYVFAGWTGLPGVMPAKDIDIYGEYISESAFIGQQFSVVYKIDGRIWKSILTETGTEVSIVPEPVREGYVFTGWSVSESFTMPDHDVVISGAFTRSGEAGQYFVNYYVPGTPLRTMKKGLLKAPAAQYDKYREDLYYTGQEIATPDAPEVDGKQFVGWSGEPSRMGNHDVDVYGVYSQQLPSELTEITTVPIFREKLVNSQTGNVRKGNKLETRYAADENYIIDGKNVVINRLEVVLPSGSTQQTNYYKVKSSSSESGEGATVQETAYIKIGDQFYVVELMDNDTINVKQEHPEETPDEYYELTDRVQEENGKYYELIKLPGKDEYKRGNELYVRSRSRATYGAFEDGAPTLLEDKDGKFTNWVYTYELYNNHNTKLSYTKTLTRDLLDKIKVVRKTHQQETEYEVGESEQLYKYLWYPSGDFYSISKFGIELAAQSVTLSGYSNVGATLNGATLTVYFLSEADAADGYVAIYIMDGQNRIAMITGNEGDKVVLPLDLKKIGYEFDGYEGTVPETFPAQSISVMTKWKKVDTDDEEQTEEKNMHLVTWKVPDYNWKYQIKVEVGELIPAAPEPDLEGVVIKSWQLSSTWFSGNTMPDFDVVYDAVVTQYSNNSHLLSYYITYTTASGREVQELYASYRLDEETPITPEPAPYKRGGTWQGWDDIPDYMPDHDVTIYGRFTGTITDTFSLNYFVDGNPYKSYTLAPGDAITPEAEPTKSGFTFSGWIGLPEVMPAMEVNVNGYYVEDSDTSKVTVSYMLEEQPYKKYTMRAGDALPAEPAPVKAGYTFSGWYPIYNIVPDHNVVISGTFYEGTAVGYVLEFYLNEELYWKGKLAAGATIEQPAVDIEGFTGWKNCPAKMPQKDLKIYGEVVSDKNYTITYMVDNEVFTTQKQFPGKTIVPPRAADKTGFAFDHWDGLPENMRMPAKDITVTAVYVESKSEYTITFKVLGEIVFTEELAPGSQINIPADPVVEGKTFDHWQGLPDDRRMPNRNVTVTAVFQGESGSYVTGTYMIEVINEDGTSSSSEYQKQNYTSGETMRYIAAPPARQGYIWVAWQSDEVDAAGGLVPSNNFTITGKFIDEDSGIIPDGYRIISWTLTLNGNQMVLLSQAVKPGDAIVEPSGAQLIADARINMGKMAFKSWGQHPDVMPDNDITIEAVLEERSGDTINVSVVYQYYNENNDVTEVAHGSYTLAEGADFSYPSDPTPDQQYSDYIFVGWTGWNNSWTPDHDITIQAVFVSASGDHGYIDNFCRITWLIPVTTTVLGARKTVHKITYVAYGQPITEPAPLENFTGDDGFEYRFVKWDNTYTVAPNLAQISIVAVIERVPVEYDVNFTLTWYHSGSNIEQNKPFLTLKAYPGTPMSELKQQALEQADAIEGWMFEGIWYPAELPEFSDMGWKNFSYYGNIYSFDYASTALNIKSWRQIKWCSRSYGVHSINGELVGYVDGSSIYTIKTEWKRIGQAITEPEESITAPFPHGSQFTFDGWEEHPTEMPDEHIIIYAKWQVIKNACNIIWRLRIVDENGNETFEDYKTTPQNQGERLTVENAPAARDGYIWAGWDLPALPGNDFWYVVWRESEHTVTGTFFNKNYEGAQISGYGKVYYRLPTHDRKIPATPYINYYVEFGKRGERIPQCPTTPEDWDGLDGYKYHFLGWDNADQTMPSVSDVYVNALDERVAQQFKVTYYLTWYHSSSNIEQEKLYTTKLIYADADMSEADITPEIPDGYIFGGEWHAKYYFTYDKMPWYDLEYYGDVYSIEYAQGGGVQIKGYHKVYWFSHGYDIQIDTHLPVARTNEDWQVCPMSWVKVGDPIVEPEGPFTPNFAHGSQFEWDGWDTHPDVMPDHDVTVWAKWKVIVNVCRVTWRFELIAADGSKSYETFQTVNWNQGDHKYNSDIPTAPERSGYVWAGWEVPYLNAGEWIQVPYQSEWTLTGTYYSVDYDGYAPAGYSVVYFRTKTHDTKYPPQAYNDFWHTLAKEGSAVPMPPTNPT